MTCFSSSQSWNLYSLSVMERMYRSASVSGNGGSCSGAFSMVSSLVSSRVRDLTLNNPSDLWGHKDTENAGEMRAMMCSLA